MRKALLRANLPFGGKASQPMSLDEYCFKHEPADYNVYWDVRKGLIPIVGAARETGAPRSLSGPKTAKGAGMMGWAEVKLRVKGCVSACKPCCWTSAAQDLVCISLGVCCSLRV